MVIILTGSGSGKDLETSTVKYKIAEDNQAGDVLLVQTSFGVTPGAPLPIFYHPVTGLRADNNVVSRNKDGLPIWLQVSVPHTLAGGDISTATTTGDAHTIRYGELELVTISPGSPPVLEGYWEEDLSGVKLTLETSDTVSPVLFEGTLGGSSEKRVWRTGTWVDERSYYVQLQGGGGELGPGLRLYVDRVLGKRARLTVEVANSTFKPLTTSLSAAGATDPGEQFAKHLKLSGLPVGVAATAHGASDNSMDLGNEYLMKPEDITNPGGDPEQLLPLGVDNQWHVTLYDTGETRAVENAAAFGQCSGYATAVDGDYRLDARAGYGFGLTFGLNPDQLTGLAYKDHTSAVRGADSFENLTLRDERFTQDMIYALQNDTEGDGVEDAIFPHARSGMFRSYSYDVTAHAGGTEVNIVPDAGHNGWGFTHSMMRHKHTMMRDTATAIHPTTGAPLYPSDFVALNVAGGGKAPWEITFRGKDSHEVWAHCPPCFQRGDSTTYSWFPYSGSTKAARAIGQQDHAWNDSQVGADRNALNDGQQRRRIHEKFSEFDMSIVGGDGNHQARIFNAPYALAFSANMAFAKDWAIRQGVRGMTRSSPYELDPAFDFLNSRFYTDNSASSSLWHVIDRLNTLGGKHEAGAHGTGMNRGHGMTYITVAAGFMLADPLDTKYRTESGPWLDVAAEAVWSTATGYGAMVKNDASHSQANQNDGFAMLQYPAALDFGPASIATRSGAIPIDHTIQALDLQVGLLGTQQTPGQHWAISQSFQTYYATYGVTSVMRAMAATGSAAWDWLKVCQNFPIYMWRYARKAGEDRHCNFIILNESAGGSGDLVGEGQGPWPGGEKRPGEWLFEVTPTYGPWVPFPKVIDDRCLPSMSVAVMAALEDGDTDTAIELTNHMIGWTGEATSAAAITSLTASISSEKAWLPWRDKEWAKSSHGSAISTIRGMISLGHIS